MLEGRYVRSPNSSMVWMFVLWLIFMALVKFYEQEETIPTPIPYCIIVAEEILK